MSMRQVLSNPAGRFANHVLRGVGQVMLQNNPITGLLFLAGIFINDRVSGLYAVLGTVVSTGTAWLLDAPQNDISRGLFGLNGTLAALGLAFYLRHDAALLAYVIVASMFATIVTTAIQDISGAQGHALTARSS